MGLRDSPVIGDNACRKAIDTVRLKLSSRLLEKGCGAFVSRHEIFGIVAEEYDELLEAVRSKSLECVHDELLDIAVACVFGMACICENTTDW